MGEVEAARCPACECVLSPDDIDVMYLEQGYREGHWVYVCSRCERVIAGAGAAV